jgi:adenylate cyclase
MNMVNKLNAIATKLWSELRRRRVIRTTVAFVVVAWIIVEGASIIFPALLLPDWTFRLVVVSAILGLPLVIVLAWMFDIERKPENKENSAEYGIHIRDVKDETLQSRVPPNLSSAIASVAVLPFKNLSRNEKHRFIADGIATELHSTLAKVHRLRVASRTSSFSLAGTDADVREIARRLNVHFVISGSVECIEDQMRLIVEFDNADEGVQIWSESYDRDVKDLFSIQQEIAQAITSEFGGARLRDEITSASSRPTASLDAWGLVQRARSYALSFTPLTLSNAVPLLHQAIELDAEYAAAHAALASVLSEQVLNGLSDEPQSDRQMALESAERACSIAPVDPFVLKMCGAVSAYFGKPESSIRALRQAVDIAPFDFGAWGYMGWPLVETGSQKDHDELHEIMERILKATPLHPGAPYWLYHQSVACTFEGRNELAVDLARQSVGRNPRFPWAWMQYANALGIVNAANSAKEAIDRCKEISPGLTPDYYELMIRGMSTSKEIANLRLAGLRSLNLLSF